MIRIIKKAEALKAIIEVNYNYGCSSVVANIASVREHTDAIEVTFNVTSSIANRAEALLAKFEKENHGTQMTFKEEYGYKVIASRFGSNAVEFSIQGIPSHSWKEHKAKYRK